MRAFLSRLFGRSPRRPAKRQRFRKLVAEQHEIRAVLATTGIVVSDDATHINGSDIVTFNYSGGTGGMFSTIESGSFPIPFFPSPGMPPQPGRNGVWEFVGMGDVNADGKLDIIAKDSGVATSSKKGQWWVGKNNGADQFQFSLWDGDIPVTAGIYGGTHQLTWGDHQVADFTGDGRADVLARVRETGNWYLWTTNATGTGFTAETTGITPKSSLFGTWNITLADDAVTEHHFQWRDALVGDFNGDGLADLAGRRITNDTGPTAFDEWYVGLGTAATTNRGETGIVPNAWWNVTSWQHDTTLVTNDTTWANAVVGDFNDDGQDDIAGRAAYPTLASGTREGEWWVSYTPDLVGDKVPAVAWADWQHALLGTQHHWRDVQAGDFNNDGKDDILGRSQAGTLLLVDGATGTTSTVGSWAGSTSYPVIVAGDFTGDGLIDLAARNGMQWHLSIFTGTSFPTPTPKGGYRMLDSSQRDDFFVKGSPQADIGSSLPLSLLQDLGRFSPMPDQFKDPQYILGRYNADGTLEYEGYGGGIPFNSVTINYKLHLDFNGDDIQDVLSQSSSGQWYYSENYGNSYVTAISDLSWVYEEYRNVLVGDFTGDGKDDLLSQKETDPGLSAEWYLHASRGDGTFSTAPVHTRSYTTTGEHVWTIGGLTGDFNNDGKDDVAYMHKENDDPYDPTWVVEVVFSSGTSPTPAVPDPIQSMWAGIFYWSKDATSTEYSFDLWGVGDFDGDGADDVWGMQMTTIIVGPPQLTEQHDQLWVGFDGGGTFPAVYTFPEIHGAIIIDSRGSKSGRFDSSADNRDDVVFEVNTNPYGGGQTQLRVISSATWGVDLVDTAGRVGGEQFTMVGDLDNDGSDDMIWIGTTPNHPIDLFVRSKVETIPCVLSGEVMFPGAVTNYIWTTSSRLRRRKPS
jgi:hypothetical protein